MLPLVTAFFFLFCAVSAQAGFRSDLFRHAKEGTVLVVAIDDATHSVSIGSGFFIDDKGLLITNAHVIEQGARLHVYVRDRFIHSDPRVVALDPDLDLVALQLEQTDGRVLSLASAIPEEGTEVIAVGYPRITDILQMGFALHATVGSGTVGGVAQGRSRTTGRATSFVQTTGILNFGNSGGPLIDTETGEVVGMIVTTVPYQERAKDRSGTAIASVTMKSGIGYSIPAPVIRQWLAANRITPRSKPFYQELSARGPDPEVDRSFATGHLLHTIALVLLQDADLLRLAVYHYESALSMNPDAIWMTRNLGQAYAALGQWNQALDLYLQGLTRTPHDTTLLNDAGVALERTGRKERAIEFYRAAVGTDPRSSSAHNKLGQALWDMGRLDEALAEFRQALDLDPQLGAAAYHLGLVLEAKGLKEEALKTWQAYLARLGPELESNEWAVQIRESMTRGTAPPSSSIATPVKEMH
jgi:Tfp pilus assembly protein PilF